MGETWVSWTDQHGDHGSIMVGDVDLVAPPKEGELADDVVALVTVKAHNEDVWTPVYLPRPAAEKLHHALGDALGAARPVLRCDCATESPTMPTCRSEHLPTCSIYAGAR